ncbi:hypothetical protein [Hazenella coriacea]|uniref:Uncharacterized protein n=1 Tax=Hazenella coriacea TaxID=1179467 RepID=A0A4R3L772_9BACL|nr:hypothetical protein [Hazenella coriacea]TCS95613.1 hypothetical protein EDD58_102187 [Hazenella coriacea]
MNPRGSLTKATLLAALIHIDDDSNEDANSAVDVIAYWHVGLNRDVIMKGVE